MLVVVITGFLSAVELYFLHLVLPDWKSAANPDTSYLEVMRDGGWLVLFTVFSVIMSVSQFGAGFSVQVNAARLLYGMGRDNVLPSSMVRLPEPAPQNPTWNIIMVGVFAFVGTVTVPFDRACDF